MRLPRPAISSALQKKYCGQWCAPQINVLFLDKLLRFRQQLLSFDKLRIFSIKTHELAVGAFFNNSALKNVASDERNLIEDGDFIGISNGRKTMRDNDRGPALGCFIESRLRTPSRRNCTWTRLSLCASSADVASSSSSTLGSLASVLAMATRCFCPPESCTPPSPINVSYPCVCVRRKGVNLRRLHDELVRVGHLAHADHLVRGNVRVPEANVVGDRVTEENGLWNSTNTALQTLLNNAHDIAQPFNVQVADLLPVQCDTALLIFVESREQTNSCGFAATAETLKWFPVLACVQPGRLSVLARLRGRDR